MADKAKALETVIAQLDELLGVAARLALVPEFLAAARPKPGGLLLEGELYRFGIHPRHHQDFSCFLLLHDARDEALLVECQIRDVHMPS